MKTLFSSVERECRLMARNGISLFMALAPALMAVLFIVIFGAMQNTSLTFAVGPGVDPAAAAKLSEIADLEYFDSLETLRGRVARMDSVAGVTAENGVYKLLVEGNEGGEFADGMQRLLGLAIAGNVPDFRTEAVKPTGSLAYDVSLISVLLFSLFVGGATLGLSVVTERESGVIAAVAVSPLPLGGYVMTKLVPAAILSAVGMAAASLIMGTAETLPGLLLLALASVPVMGLLLLVLGALAKTQIASVGVLKLIMPLSLVLPISAVFVPARWHFLYYWFPMYWQYAAIDALHGGGSAAFPVFMTLAVGVPWFALALWLFAKRTKLRFGR